VRRIAAVALAVAVLAVPAAASSRIVVAVRGSSTSLVSTSCFIRLSQRIVGGGTLTYCLKVFHGEPGPNATVRDSGAMTFALAHGTIRANVSIVQRFAADGVHATQSLAGKIAGGTGRYAHATGSVKGGGRVVEKPPGHIAWSNLRYVLS
jgi:hypothetical protein